MLLLQIIIGALVCYIIFQISKAYLFWKAERDYTEWSKSMMENMSEDDWCDCDECQEEEVIVPVKKAKKAVKKVSKKKAK